MIRNAVTHRLHDAAAWWLQTVRAACVLGTALAVVVLMSACDHAADPAARESEPGSRPDAHLARPSPVPRSASRATSSRAGFHSRSQMDRHFEKHGAEFGHVTEGQYLGLAQSLRDAPLGGAIEELKRPDGTVSRFDRESGAFVAFDPDGTILTFFKPNTGESYFRRQATHTH